VIAFIYVPCHFAMELFIQPPDSRGSDLISNGVLFPTLFWNSDLGNRLISPWLGGTFYTYSLRRPCVLTGFENRLQGKHGKHLNDLGDRSCPSGLMACS
jgi:hypothetical protein